MTVQEPLSASYLMEHVRALSNVIGPRPAGSRAELQARQYIRHALADAGIAENQIEEMPFKTFDSWGYPSLISGGVVVISSLLNRFSRILGVAAAIVGTYNLYGTVTGRRQLIEVEIEGLTNPSANLIVRIPAQGKPQRKVVLIGHTDSNKHRLTFMPQTKATLRSFTSFSLALAATNTLAQIFGIKWLQRLTVGLSLAAIPVVVLDELGGFIDGANDNATAVACLLGLGAAFTNTPLQNTEVWLAFTGAEEVGCIGMQRLLDKYREQLADAYFIDFEMVGAGEIAYITHHTGLTHFTAYEPDADSLALAVETARDNPAMGVRGVPLVITEEVSTLRGRGFRGICLAGIGDDGWLVNWHQYSDNFSNILPEPLEKAARFAHAMIRKLDERQ